MTATCSTTTPPTSPGIGRRVRTLPRSVAYWHVTAVMGLALFSSVVPTSLYDRYAALWHFSALTLTLVYATYAFGVLAALLLAGRVSDQVGRRPVLIVALAALIVSSALFMVADSTGWLFVARAVQGLATGTAVSAASAAMLDLHPRRDPVNVGLANGVASATGLGLSLVLSSALVEAGAAPRVLPYVVLLILLIVALAGAYLMPEPVTDRSAFRLTPQRPSVPSGIRHAFLLAGLAVLSSWSIGGLFFSLGDQLSAQLFHSRNLVVATLGATLLCLSGALAQLVVRRVAPWLGASAGSVALAAGMVLIVLGASADSIAAFLVGAVIAGVGFGVGFLGGLRQLVAVIPPHHRASVMSAFYVVAYISLSVPAVLAGVVVTHLGLDTTFEIFGIAVAAIALVVAVEGWRTRPRFPR